MKQIVVIPARLNSSRFPNKILFDIKGLPMIEHVRRRVLLAKEVKDVFIATCDIEIKEVMESFGANVIMTSNQHLNGTSRVAEAVEGMDFSEVILVQGDEPLLLPYDVDRTIKNIRKSKNIHAWNATGPIYNPHELMKQSFVKCAIHNSRILYCFRRSPSFNNFDNQKKYIRKILGVIAFKKEFLNKITKSNPTPIERIESIEQMRIIEAGYNIQSIPFKLSQPSINEPNEVNEVLKYISQNTEQQSILKQVLSFKD
jgi:3-deoxy-manno-octulosonate cytidylyltransferase (CMP-KDO synthetase)